MENLLLDASGDGFVKVDDSIDFNPPPISSHEAATGFEGEFTETVIIEGTESVMSSSNRVPTVQDK